MTIQMFAVETGDRRLPSRFLLRPSLGVLAWAEAATFATVAGSRLSDLAGQWLAYLSLGLGASIANTPDLQKYEQPPVARFTSSRLVASLRLANERMPHELEHFGLTGSGVEVSVAAVHFHGTVAHLVMSGPPVDVWQFHKGELRSLCSRRAQQEGRERVEAPFEPALQQVSIATGDLLAIGLLTDPAITHIRAHANRVDDLLAGLLEQSEACGQSVILARARG